MKRALSFLLVFLLCLSLFPLGALADEEPEVIVEEEILTEEPVQVAETVEAAEADAPIEIEESAPEEALPIEESLAEEIPEAPEEPTVPTEEAPAPEEITTAPEETVAAEPVAAVQVEETAFIEEKTGETESLEDILSPAEELVTDGDALPEEAGVPAGELRVELEPTAFTYDGTEKRPAVTVTWCADGAELEESEIITLQEGTDYTVEYADNIGAGTATVTVTGLGDHTGTATATFPIAKARDTITAKSFTKVWKAKAQSFKLGAATIGGKLTYKSSSKSVTVSKAGKVTIAKGFVGRATITITSAATENCEKCVKKITVTVNPAAVKLSAVNSAAKSKATVKWKKSANSGITGYQIQYSLREDFSGAKTVKVKGVNNVSKVVAKLSAGKTYHVRVRTYQVVSKKTYYSAWSASSSVKVKATAEKSPAETPSQGGVDRSTNVYVSNSGKIHTHSDCSGMKYYTTMTYGEALNSGYIECKKCF